MFGSQGTVPKTSSEMSQLLRQKYWILSTLTKGMESAELWQSCKQMRGLCLGVTPCSLGKECLLFLSLPSFLPLDSEMERWGFSPSLPQLPLWVCCKAEETVRNWKENLNATLGTLKKPSLLRKGGREYWQCQVSALLLGSHFKTDFRALQQRCWRVNSELCGCLLLFL